MNRLAAARSMIEATQVASAECEINGQRVALDAAGALYLPDQGLLCVSDLHLEKGAAHARRGQLLPPWDTLATLKLLESVIARFDPRIVISLGDNFHDRNGSAYMPAEFRLILTVLTRGREWIWISGNHDPDGVTGLPGICADSLAYGGLHFRHDPLKKSEVGEISGHLHPAATLRRRERSVKRPCFATDGNRLIMPSFGVMTGGLDISNRAFAGLFDRTRLTAHMLSQGRIHSFSHDQLRG